ncbi:NAD(P)-dependent oxidoreductase [Natronoglomus mannanivorans]|uniref:NAD(P)-dependent oxidoreductase n=1 Tax=Natronoglomus mannanivorans TaxID=2979990 RepID=A0AAP2Z1T0_9EURY|nr:NAD(P)-dependent oxidoreductase [Halobacteria archaeon AArc-xg1-1]
MNVLLTGANGIVGTAITDALGDRSEYSITGLDIQAHPDRETVVADVAEYDRIRPAFDGIDAVVHMAVYPPGFVDESWEDILRVNVRGTRNVLRAAADAEVESVVFGSSNHVVGMYEREYAPDIYDPNVDLTIDHTDPVRPDSTYAVSKLFGEHDGRFFVETNEYPKRFYALRIASMRPASEDHPYASAERGVEDGKWDRDSDEYRQKVARLKALWFSRRDCGHMIDRMLQDETVTYDVFYGISDNDRRWLDIDHARAVLGYEPRDNGDEWDGPPSV